MLFKVLVLGFSALILSVTAHAQTACPPGLVPYAAGAGGGVATCGPAPTNNQQPMQRPPLWADRWGAVAVGTPGGTPAFGASTNMSSRSKANRAALAECGAQPGAKCRIDATYHNQCVALVVGDKISASYNAPTAETATQKSMEFCKAHGNTQCRLYYSACSYPERIQ